MSRVWNSLDNRLTEYLFSILKQEYLRKNYLNNKTPMECEWTDCPLNSGKVCSDHGSIYYLKEFIDLCKK